MAEAKRHLVAIMFTDIKGFTAMMQEDEALAIRKKETHRQIFTSVTNKYNGNIIQYFGDGSLSTFDSVIDAVNCARELQINWIKESLPVRIGIHLGEIVFEGDDIIGDGVNVASRVESLGEPGSVLVSDKVIDSIRNHKEFEWVNLGRYPLKNVDTPPDIHALNDPGLYLPNRREIKKKVKPDGVNYKYWIAALIVLLAIVAGIITWDQYKTQPQTIEYKRLAVMPFQDLTGNKGEKEFLIKGIRQDLIIRLGKVPGIRVLSARSTQKYKNTEVDIPEIISDLDISFLIDGSYQTSDSILKVNIHLTDVAKEENLYSDTFSRSLEELLDVQNEISEKVYSALNFEYAVARGSIEPASESYQLYLEGLGHREEKNWEKSIELFFNAYNADSTNLNALYMLSETIMLGEFELGLQHDLPLVSSFVDELDERKYDPTRVYYLKLWSDFLSTDDTDAGWLEWLEENQNSFINVPEYYLLKSEIALDLGLNQIFKDNQEIYQLYKL